MKGYGNIIQNFSYYYTFFKEFTLIVMGTRIRESLMKIKWMGEVS